MDRRRLLAALTAAAGAISIAATATIRSSGPGAEQQDAATWLLAEPLVLAALVGAVVRWSSPRAGAVAGSLAALGSALWVQRFLTDASPVEAVAASASWLVPSLGLGVIAWYLRWAAVERERAIAAVRAEQRSRLALDLHDYVAHDISEIVARAQAGSAVLPLGDPRVAELLDQIAAAGLRALESMDQTVHALGDDDDPAHATRGGLEEIDELVRRFSAAGEVSAAVAYDVTERVDARAGAEAYRAVVEALTNVRRHALRATAVAVGLTQSDGLLVVSIADDGDSRPGPAGAVGGGLGLAAMAERVERLGGSVEAGPRDGRGWLVSVTLPLARTAGAEVKR